MLIVPTIFSVWKPDSDAQLDNIIRKQGTKTTRRVKKCLCLTLVLPVVGHIVWAKFPFFAQTPLLFRQGFTGAPAAAEGSQNK